MREHTASAFDGDLRWLSRKLAEMARFSEQQVSEATSALVKRDQRGTGRVISEHAAMDSLGQEITGRGILTIARRQPMAVDLREIVGALSTCRDLEQIGELATGIARRAAVILRSGVSPMLLDSMDKLATIVLEQLIKVDDAYVARDVSSALSVIRGDANVDEAFVKLLCEVQLQMQQAPWNVEVGSDLIFCAANLEQIGNLAAHTAATIYYIVEGRTLGEAGFA